MSENTRLIERLYECLATGNWSAAPEILSPDVVTTAPGAPTMHGIEPFVEFARAFKLGLPDSRIEPARMLEVGDTVVVEGAFRGSFTGTLPTPQGAVPGNGRTLDLRFCDVFDVEAGRISRHGVYFDQVDFLAQLGLMPEPTQA